MSAFLKPKQSKSGASLAKPTLSKHTSSTEAICSPSGNDFAKAFKPFVIRKDATLAPINWFQHQKRGKQVIVIDADASPVRPNSDEDVEMLDVRDSREPKGMCKLTMYLRNHSLMLGRGTPFSYQRACNQSKTQSSPLKFQVTTQLLRSHNCITTLRGRSPR